MSFEQIISELDAQSFNVVVEALKAKGDPLSIAAMKLLVQLDEEREANQSRLDKLDALENNGVDNWEWYNLAMEDLRQSNEED